jgi:hypothetical protein
MGQNHGERAKHPCENTDSDKESVANDRKKTKFWRLRFFFSVVKDSHRLKLRGRIGKQGDVPCSLNSNAKLPLVTSAISGNTPWYNLEPLCYERLQKVFIFKIYHQGGIGTEATTLSLLEAAFFASVAITFVGFLHSILPQWTQPKLWSR